jgi:cyclic pyranopterin phosphate synthase
MDAYGRKVDYLRISITDRCNESCLYCLPEGFRNWRRRDLLSVEEIIRVVQAAAGLGFRKFRLTGGEPLLRDDAINLATRMASIEGVKCIGISTNGTRLAPMAAGLRKAGIRTVNISLDALNPATYLRITRGRIEPVLAGIRAAIDAGFECIKLNCVLMRGLNEQELWPLILFAAEHKLPLRLIELMPITRSDVLSEENFLSITQAMDLIRQKDDLEPQPNPALGFGPARYFRLRKTGALVGFIGSMTNHQFCESCNRIRMTADGLIRPCLGNHGELNIKEAIRSNASNDTLAAFLRQAIDEKPKEHQFRGHYVPCRPMTAIGG